MKQFKLNLGAIFFMAILSACGSDNSSIPQPISGGGGYGGGCVPLSAPIGFTGTGNYYSGARVAGGELPLWYFNRPMYPTGQVLMGGGGGGPYSRQRPDGSSISMNIVPVNQGGSGYGNFQANTNGVLQLSPTTVSAIQSQFGYFGTGWGQPGYTQNQTNLCVSKVSFDLAIYGGQLANEVFLYINGPQGVLDAISIYF